MLLFFPDIPIGHQLELMPEFDADAVVTAAYARRIESVPHIGVDVDGRRAVIWRMPGAIRAAVFNNEFHPGVRDGSLP